MSHGRVYFSFRSPYAWLGLHLINRAGLNPELLHWTRFDENRPQDAPVIAPEKLAYMAQDIPRMAARLGLVLNVPDPLDIKFSSSIACFVNANRKGKGLAFALATSEARWGEGKDISDPDVLKNCAVTAGLGAELVDEAVNDESVAEALRAAQMRAEEDKVFGLPFAVFGGEKFWGHDRFDLYAEAVKKATS